MGVMGWVVRFYIKKGGCWPNSESIGNFFKACSEAPKFRSAGRCCVAPTPAGVRDHAPVRRARLRPRRSFPRGAVAEAFSRAKRRLECPRFAAAMPRRPGCVRRTGWTRIFSFPEGSQHPQAGRAGKMRGPFPAPPRCSSLAGRPAALPGENAACAAPRPRFRKHPNLGGDPPTITRRARCPRRGYPPNPPAKSQKGNPSSPRRSPPRCR